MCPCLVALSILTWSASYGLFNFFWQGEVLFNFLKHFL